MSIADAQVTVVGAGPSGLMTALVLARAGVRVRVVDRSLAPITEPRAMFVQSRTLELWARLGVADAALGHGSKVQAVVLREGAEEAGRLDLARALQPDSVFPHALGLPQDRTQKLLLAELGRYPDAEVMWSATLDALSQRDPVVHVRVSTEDGPREWESEYVVGADGGSSTTRKLVGVAMPGHTFPLQELGVDVDLPTGALDGVMVSSTSMARGLSVMPIGDGRYRAFGTIGPDVRRLLRLRDDGSGITLEDVRAWFRAAIPNLPEPTAVHRSFSYRIHERVAERFRVGGVFLVGDAAHMNPPAGGQGINLGMGDGYNLGWKLAQVVTGAAHPSLLDSYEAERRPVARVTVRTVGLVYRADAPSAQERPGGAGRVRFDRARAGLTTGAMRTILRLPVVQKRLSSALTQISISYRSSPAVHDQGGGLARMGRLRAGDRVPTALLDRDLATTDRWVLLLAGDATPGTRRVVQELLTAVGALRSAPLVRELAPGDRLKQELFGARAGYALVRPDGHIAYRGFLTRPLEGFRGYLRRNLTLVAPELLHVG